MGLAGKEQGKNRGIAGGAGEPAKATRLRLYRRRPKASPRSRAAPRSGQKALNAARPFSNQLNALIYLKACGSS
jgi:hypothetical protein